MQAPIAGLVLIIDNNFLLESTSHHHPQNLLHNSFQLVDWWFFLFVVNCFIHRLCLKIPNYIPACNDGASISVESAGEDTSMDNLTEESFPLVYETTT